MPQPAIFDLDGTLIPNPSAEWRFAGHLIRAGRVSAGRILKSLGFSLHWLPTYGRQVWKKNKAYLAGFHDSEVRDWAEAFVHEQLTGLLRPDVLARLRQHQDNGDTVVLLTGTINVIAQPLAEYLGITRCIACECVTQDGYFLPVPPQRHPFAHEKLVLAQALCAELGYPMEKAIAYADSRHDLPLLRAVGHAVAVRPDRTLRRIAQRSGWEILDPLE